MLIDKDNVVFSQTGRLQKEISGALNASIFGSSGFKVISKSNEKDKLII